MRFIKNRPMWRVSGLALAVAMAQGAVAQDNDLEEVIITGTRLADRSAPRLPGARRCDHWYRDAL